MPFRDLIRLSSPQFLALGFVARLPQSMTPLAILLLLSASAGDYALAGYAAGARSITQIVGALVIGRLADRRGIRRVGVVTALLNAGATACLLTSAGAGAPVLLGVVALTGLTQPPIGAFNRAHWMTVLRRRSGLLDTALSYEAAADELSFVVGPILAGLLAAVDTPIGPVLPLGFASMLSIVAGVPFARRYADDSGRADRPATRPGTIPSGTLAALITGMGVVGMTFGVVQTGVTAYATDQGHSGHAGTLYALLALGNASASVACARLPQRFPLARRHLVFALGLQIGTVLIAAATAGALPIPIAIFICGTTIAPYMITLFRLAGQLCPERTSTVLAAVGAGASAGTGIGQAVTGFLLTEYDVTVGFLLAPLAATISLALAGWHAARSR